MPRLSRDAISAHWSRASWTHTLVSVTARKSRRPGAVGEGVVVARCRCGESATCADVWPVTQTGRQLALAAWADHRAQALLGVSETRWRAMAARAQAGSSGEAS